MSRFSSFIWMKHLSFSIFCFLKAALNFALSCLRVVTLGGKLLKIFMPA